MSALSRAVAQRDALGEEETSGPARPTLGEPRSGSARERLSASSARLRVRWFDRWSHELDEALELLPALEGCPPGLLRSLMVENAAGRKRAALVTCADRPVALPILRRTGRFAWEPVTQWLLPRVVFPVQPGFLVPALEALGVDIWVGWWRWHTPPPASRYVRNRERSVTYGADLKQDYEAHWRRSRHHKDVRAARNRCRDLTLALDSPGAAEWTIRNWARVWGVNAVELQDRLLVAEALERASLQHTHLLLDGDQPIAGATNTVDGSTVVAGVIYRDPRYESRSIGTHVIDEVFRWAAQAGYSHFDLGGGHDYKARWAPESGERWSINLCPSSFYWAKRAAIALVALLEVS